MPKSIKPKPEKITSAGRKILAGLEQLRDAYVSGDFSKLTVRTVEIPEPHEYRARDIKTLRESMGVSQGVFARLVAVSPELVAHWEHGLRKPAPLACRLFDQIREDPAAFVATYIHRKSA